MTEFSRMKIFYNSPFQTLSTIRRDKIQYVDYMVLNDVYGRCRPQHQILWNLHIVSHSSNCRECLVQKIVPKSIGDTHLEGYVSI